MKCLEIVGIFCQAYTIVADSQSHLQRVAIAHQISVKRSCHIMAGFCEHLHKFARGKIRRPLLKSCRYEDFGFGARCLYSA